MTPELKAKWVEALRSGKYEQGRHKLSEDGLYCCLGVLRDVAELPDVPDESPANEWLSPMQLEMVGLTWHISGRLAKMNDDLRPFSRIADYIEETL